MTTNLAAAAVALLVASCASSSTPPQPSTTTTDVTLTPAASASSARVTPGARGTTSASSTSPAIPSIPSKPTLDETGVPECNAYVTALRACEPTIHAEIQSGKRPVAASEIYSLKLAISQLASGTPGLDPKVSARMLDQIAQSCEASRQELPASCRP